MEKKEEVKTGLIWRGEKAVSGVQDPFRRTSTETTVDPREK